MVVVNVLLIGLFFGYILFNYQIRPRLEDGSLFAPVASSTMSAVSVGVPIRLKIPSLAINAPIESVGIDAYGVMLAPIDPVKVAWLNLGPNPGDIGTSVMNGHFGWKDGIPAVFDTLHAIKVGAKILVVDVKGVSTTFVVRAIKIYGFNTDATEAFESVDGKTYLNLITCGGAWDAVTKNYSNRLVVFAEKE